MEIENRNPVSSDAVLDPIWLECGVEASLDYAQRLQRSWLSLCHVMREHTGHTSPRSLRHCLEGLESFFGRVSGAGLERHPLRQLCVNLSNIVSQLNAACGKNDLDAAADIIEYRLVPNLHEWILGMKQLLGR